MRGDEPDPGSIDQELELPIPVNCVEDEAWKQDNKEYHPAQAQGARDEKQNSSQSLKSCDESKMRVSGFGEVLQGMQQGHETHNEQAQCEHGVKDLVGTVCD